LGKLTWEQARALVERAYQPSADLHPALRPIKMSPVVTDEDSDFVRQFLQRLRRRIQARDANNE
jgi:hypothetical protein